MAPDTAGELKRLREEVDAIDEEFAALLARRFQVTEQIGRRKVQIGEAAINPERQAQRRAFLTVLAQRYALPEEVLMDLHRRLSTEVVARHRRQRTLQQRTRL